MRIQKSNDNANYIFFDRSRFSSNIYLFYVAIFSTLCDIVSTILSIETVGYSYEGNVFIREIIHDLGVLGFVSVKFSLTFLALLATYYIVKYKDIFGWKNVKMFYGIYIGNIISNFFAASSNLSVIYAGSSFYFLNFNSLQIGMFLLFIPPVAGFVLDMRDNSKTNCTIDRRTWI